MKWFILFTCLFYCIDSKVTQKAQEMYVQCLKLKETLSNENIPCEKILKDEEEPVEEKYLKEIDDIDSTFNTEMEHMRKLSQKINGLKEKLRGNKGKMKTAQPEVIKTAPEIKPEVKTQEDKKSQFDLSGIDINSFQNFLKANNKLVLPDQNELATGKSTSTVSQEAGQLLSRFMQKEKEEKVEDKASALGKASNEENIKNMINNAFKNVSQPGNSAQTAQMNEDFLKMIGTVKQSSPEPKQKLPMEQGPEDILREITGSFKTKPQQEQTLRKERSSEEYQTMMNILSNTTQKEHSTDLTNKLDGKQSDTTNITQKASDIPVPVKQEKMFSLSDLERQIALLKGIAPKVIN